MNSLKTTKFVIKNNGYEFIKTKSEQGNSGVTLGDFVLVWKKIELLQKLNKFMLVSSRFGKNVKLQ